jgi:2-polyprenyl-3-methyl-5-hydroxy-6-metoxy-1,4-benzoquinol methylase
MPKSRLPLKDLAANERDWDAMVPYHVRSEFYGVDSFLHGRSTLGPIELKEVGQVRRKRLLHLQCHFGLDTLSWARRGAIVTGVDFSSKAIEAARDLAHRSRLDAEFIRANVYRLPANLKNRFDVVFTSGGVLAWLPDMKKWARSVESCLKKGGFLYLLDAHPFVHLFENAKTLEEFCPKGNYFQHKLSEETGNWSYADPIIPVLFPRHQWQSSLQDILGAIIDSGLKLETFHEHDSLGYQMTPFLIRGRDGYWRMPPEGPNVPLSFSLKAKKI